MAYTNKVSAVAAVLFLAVVMAQRLADAQSEMFPNFDPKCATGMTNLLEKCFSTVRATPTEECCNDLKSATTTQVTCLCDNYIANPAVVNITGPYSAGITTKCGVFEKYSCDGTSKGDEEKKDESSSGSKTNSNGGATNQVAATMGVFCLVASLFFVMF